MRRIEGWLAAIRGIRRSYMQAHGRLPKLFRPRRFTEKMQWRKLFDRNALFGVFCDKLATRDWVAARIGAEYLAPVYWTGGVDEIPFDAALLPYVLKSTHASGQVMFVTQDMMADQAAVRRRAAAWLQIDYFALSGEPGYKNIPPRLVAEQIVLAEDGGAPEERRMFVFDGKVAVINTVFAEDGIIRNGAFHTPCWERLDWHFTRLVTRAFPRPKRLEEMIRVAELLGQGIDHIRVDIYDCGDRILVGELTAYAWGGLSRFNPEGADLALGRFWRLRWPLLRAIAAMTFRAR